MKKIKGIIRDHSREDKSLVATTQRYSEIIKL
jgi:hypothetical protein